MCNSLVNKYNVAGPRYTSYPTVPYWDNNSFSLKRWKESLAVSFDESNTSEGISIYIHLPFCESMCTFCGCNKRITKRHEVEMPYIKAVLKEWDLYCELLNGRPVIKELHLGGGTPTFFSAENLEYLINGITRKARLSKDYEFSFEGHPNNTTREQLQSLYDLGFRRVSFGVQDYNETVQKAINRIQPFEKVKAVTDAAREIGYTSVGHDIIFGLPFQTKSHIETTIALTKALMPDRIAFYSYAHVPWLKGNGQRGYRDEDVPNGDVKREQYEYGKALLSAAGYHEIGMDHFALQTDSLYKAMESKSLHRNFMGYTASKTQAMIGLGVSSISDSWYGFAQNVKGIEEYYHLVNQGIIPVYRGHILTPEDLIVRQHILNLMCHFETNWSDRSLYIEELKDIVFKLHEMESDGLVTFEKHGLKITEKGRPFVRNVCMAFDVLLQRKQPSTRLFSMTV
ncbi:oxygen-independent coproporphyrinogen III oxidase [Psychroserpens sp.]|uniref:oxygen-independent coproporphyrinogen III oxidase n=1 Tax=Psychroserpens sp. TaxID=2020870 RepID=UPI001B19F159|nr:oxygen-independent coproporphyrinogen III oxidase [Psychroserpens sp.]MBO6607004.1 oxygen-independent coproporphyrinogen III oxidase [Psychroserpens sp.]MBO6654150.1 oxygen-independent coproporphyrinogen III oxidase [Psychroserpens sp.]MBO6682564.1 oxygen-independent coproporphyrinogen III oxidase [Psychroserpens sp.]MBO6750776.1 oxygen-independent coproporphyrinogen III oxidase [Psychroserpens sp.]MBO6915795.1 oxygen-independent coproporphyrinogen III oxidase [Psychroserpens sp.]